MRWRVLFTLFCSLWERNLYVALYIYRGESPEQWFALVQTVLVLKRRDLSFWCVLCFCFYLFSFVIKHFAVHCAIYPVTSQYVNWNKLSITIPWLFQKRLVCAWSGSSLSVFYLRFLSFHSVPRKRTNHHDHTLWLYHTGSMMCGYTTPAVWCVVVPHRQYDYVYIRLYTLAVRDRSVQVYIHRLYGSGLYKCNKPAVR